MGEYPPFIPPPDPAFDDPSKRTVPSDARYPNTNATKWCFATFVDHKKCLRLLGEKNDCCAQFERIYKSLCPNAWISKWEEQIEEGVFPVDLPEKRKC